MDPFPLMGYDIPSIVLMVLWNASRLDAENSLYAHATLLDSPESTINFEDAFLHEDASLCV